MRLWAALGLLAVSCLPRPNGGTSRPTNGLIAFMASGERGLRQIFVAAPEGDNRRQLTFDGENVFPSWTPDGATILFSSNRNGRFEVHSMRADGSRQTAISNSAPGEEILPCSSPDGAQIAFVVVDPAVGHPEVWTMGSQGASPRRLTRTPKSASGATRSQFPRFSPDGRRILYSSTRSGGTQIWIMDADGANQTQLTSGLGPEFPHANAPNWSPAGDRIVFWAGFEGRFGEIWTMDPDGRNARQLTDQPGSASSDNPVWSPDGRLILFDTNRSGPAEIWVMEAGGANQRRLIRVDIPDTQFSWQRR